MVFGARASHHDARVVARCRHHGEHLARTRVDGHNTAHLAFEQTFAQSLQLDVDRQREVLARHWLTVVGSVHILALYASASVAQQYLHALLATQFLLIVFLDTELAYVVAGLVVVVVFNVRRRHLSHVAEDVCSVRCLILAYAALLHIETGESEHLLLKVAELLIAELAHKELLRESRVAGILGIVLYVVHALDEVFLGDAERLAEFGSVDTALCLVHHHHDVVGRLVVYEQLAVAVVYGTARRKLHLLEEGVGVGVLLVVVAHELEGEQTNYVHRDNCHGYTSNYKATVFECIPAHLLRRKFSITNISTMVSTALLTVHKAHCVQLYRLNASRLKNASEYIKTQMIV